MSDDYILVVNGKPQGPFSIEQLKQFNIRPADFVKTEKMPDYRQAHEVAELRGLFGFREQAIIPQYFGSFDQRLVASALDWFFVSLVCVPLVFIIALFTPDKEIRLALTFSLLAIIPVVNTLFITQLPNARQSRPPTGSS